MECAVLAKALATRCPAFEIQQDEAFTAGLLHDIGKIVLERHAPHAAMRIAAAIKEKGLSGIEAEIDVLGVDHAAVGEWIAMRWNIPARLREVILFHHQPHDALEKAPASADLVKAIALADLIDHLLRENPDPSHILAGLAASPLSDCGLTAETIGEILEALEQEKAEFHRLLTLGDGDQPDPS
jgi:HD-like signal output (HDOD) protein